APVRPVAALLRELKEMTITVSTAAPTVPFTIPSQALGDIGVDPAASIRLVDPIPGFPACDAYALIAHVRGGVTSSTIHWLQAVERPYHAFIVADPWAVFPDYAPELPNADAEQLALADQADARLLVIL